MKLYSLFTLLFSLTAFSQIEKINIEKSDSLKMEIIPINTSHYSGYFGKLRSQGHVLKDSIGDLISISIYCRSFENPTIFYYQLTKYYSGSKLSYDSIVDFRKKRIAKSTVIIFNEEGRKIFIRKIRSKLDPKRKDLPLNSQTFWNGKEFTYNNEGKKIYKRKLKDELF